MGTIWNHKLVINSWKGRRASPALYRRHKRWSSDPAVNRRSCFKIWRHRHLGQQRFSHQFNGDTRDQHEEVRSYAYNQYQRHLFSVGPNLGMALHLESSSHSSFLSAGANSHSPISKRARTTPTSWIFLRPLTWTLCGSKVTWRTQWPNTGWACVCWAWRKSLKEKGLESMPFGPKQVRRYI